MCNLKPRAELCFLRNPVARVLQLSTVGGIVWGRQGRRDLCVARVDLEILTSESVYQLYIP